MRNNDCVADLQICETLSRRCLPALFKSLTQIQSFNLRVLKAVAVRLASFALPTQINSFGPLMSITSNCGFGE